VLGVLQATEVVKHILGAGEPLIGRLLLFDALGMRFRELKLRRDPGCVVCGDSPSIKELIDYQQFCGMPANDHEKVEVTDVSIEIQPKELQALVQSGKAPVIIDVREPHEWEICRLDGARLIPLGELQNRMNELDTADEIVLMCKMGGRSMKALKQLQAAGFGKLKNLRGGVTAWAKEVDPSMPTY
jgi:adenylyltransferase/sulfurtransferase